MSEFLQFRNFGFSFLFLFMLFARETLAVNYTVYGQVQSNTGFVPKARISLKEINRILYTDEKGNFEFSGLTPGEYTLIIFSQGYRLKYQFFKLNNQDEYLKITLVRRNIAERIPETSGIYVKGDSLNGLGIAGSASEGTIHKDRIASRPLSRTGELEEAVPGLIATAHSGGGKANQFFLRGFTLDHGTDLSSQINGVPINLVSHAHGQGYTDLNFIIPELVEKIKFKKGVYYAEEGNFATAGSVNSIYARSLPQGIISIEGGTFGYARSLLANSHKIVKGNLIYAVETSHSDGPWTIKDNYKKMNGVLGYSHGTDENGYSILLMGYRGSWHSTDQVPKRAFAKGKFSEDGLERYDAVSPDDGAYTNRGSVTFEVNSKNSKSAMKFLLYGVYYDLSIFSDFTYFLNDSVRGDQFEQYDKRTYGGAKTSYTLISNLFGIKMENQAGFQFRYDYINNGVYHTEKRAKLDTIRESRIVESNASVFYENKMQWLSKLRSVIGTRFDTFYFHVDDSIDANSNRKSAHITSPKGSVIFGPWKKTEFYLNGGYGFRSNDARGLKGPNETELPITRAKGAETGIRTSVINGLSTTITFWRLNLDSELIFSGDTATTTPNGPSLRRGIELSNFYKITSHLSVDADVTLSRARFTGDNPEENYIPGSLEKMAAGGITLSEWHGFFGSLRIRYFGARPLVEDNTVRSPATTLGNLQVGKNINQTWKVVFEVFNIANATVSDIDYYYASRLKHEEPGPDEGGYNDIHTHPSQPRSVRFSVRAVF